MITYEVQKAALLKLWREEFRFEADRLGLSEYDRDAIFERAIKENI